MSGERRMAMARSVEELLGLGFDRSSVEIACTDEWTFGRDLVWEI